MSGGHYLRFPYYLDEFIVQIEDDLENDERVTDKFRIAVLRFHSELKEIEPKIRLLDMAMSGDSNGEDFIKSMELRDESSNT